MADDSGVTGNANTNEDGRSDVREAFSLLNHEIRLEIVLALLEDWHAVDTEPKSYAELMDAVDMRDSGKFNYHLDKLRGVYVRQVEDGYVPTASVTALYRTVLAHRPTERPEYEPAEIESACPRCGAAPVLRYERGFVTVDCAACEGWVGFTYPFPTNGLEGRDADAVARAVARRAERDVGLARAGQCPFCAGTTTVDVRIEPLAADSEPDEEDGASDVNETDGAADAADHWVEITCDDCTFLVGVEPLGALLTDGRVASALADVGVALDAYDWERPTPTARLESRDPVRIALEVRGDRTESGTDDGGNGDAETATIVVDESLDVRSVAVE